MKRQTGGFALIESLIAVLILMFGILGAIGMQARGITAVTDASGRAEVCVGAEELIGIMWSDTTGNMMPYAWDGSGSPPPAYRDWYNAFAEKHPGVKLQVGAAAFNNGYRMSVVFTWQVPGTHDAPRTYAVTTYISPP